MTSSRTSLAAQGFPAHTETACARTQRVPLREIFKRPKLIAVCCVIFSSPFCCWRRALPPRQPMPVAQALQGMKPIKFTIKPTTLGNTATARTGFRSAQLQFREAEGRAARYPTGNEADQIYNLACHTWQFCNGTSWVSTTPQACYQGPGDIVSGATAWYGLRAYNGAATTGTQKAINIRRASDNTTTDIYILTTGNLDTATAASFAGTDATATCSTSGSSTTLSCTSASSTPHANDPISGTGITQPAYIVSCGRSQPCGTCTMNVAQNIASAETVTFQVALFVTEMYDQTGNGHNITQSISAQQIQLFQVCINGLPCTYFNGSNQFLASASVSWPNAPVTVSVVAQHTVVGGGTSVLYGGANSQTWGGFGNANNVAYIRAFSNATAPATDKVWHAVTYLYGSSTGINVDGVLTSNSIGTLNLGTGVMYWGGNSYNSGYGSQFVGYATEFGLWPSAFTSTQQTNICHNQYIYWGTSTAC